MIFSEQFKRIHKNLSGLVTSTMKAATQAVGEALSGRRSRLVVVRLHALAWQVMRGFASQVGRSIAAPLVSYLLWHWTGHNLHDVAAW